MYAHSTVLSSGLYGVLHAVPCALWYIGLACVIDMKSPQRTAHDRYSASFMRPVSVTASIVHELKINSVAFNPQANYTDRATAAC
jgi:hypothetical protein